jgi:single-strand DNA-binding protein
MINRVILVGNLARDPELKTVGGGSTVCSLRLAVSERVKDRISGEWTDTASYFNVSVFGAQGERCAQYLAKGRQVAIDGRLRWREWLAKDGQKREAVSVVAEVVEFLGRRESATAAGDRDSDDIPL